MTISLTVDQRGRLRRALQQGFDPTSLNMFLEERMGTRLADMVPLPDNFESQCNNLIQWAVAHGRFDELCQRIQDHIQERGGPPDLQQVVTELLASATERRM